MEIDFLFIIFAAMCSTRVRLGAAAGLIFSPFRLVGHTFSVASRSSPEMRCERELWEKRGKDITLSASPSPLPSLRRRPGLMKAAAAATSLSSHCAPV